MENCARWYGKAIAKGRREALIRIVAAGICGSDIGAFRETNGLVSYPRVIGHELAGVVESIPKSNKNGIKPGDRVVIDPYIYCGHCYPCSIGRTNCCVDLKVLGVQTEGESPNTLMLVLKALIGRGAIHIDVEAPHFCVCQS